MRPILLLGLLVVVSLSGCAQVGVSNNTNSFSYGGQVAGKTDSISYEWKNTGSKANINWGGQAASGTMVLTIKDAAGANVFTKTISGASQSGSSDSTKSGKSGDWTITLSFNDFTGQMGLNVNGGMGSSFF